VVDEVELLSDFEALEPEPSDFGDSDFFSVEPDELSDSEPLLAEPLAELLAASRLSVR
jgi:hypothetical protein